jgi:hypothetical protein
LVKKEGYKERIILTGNCGNYIRTMNYENYDYWKILAWRFIRSGISGGIGMVVLVNVTIRPDWSDANLVFKTIGAAFLSGFISAVALAIRDYFGNEDKSSKIDKLPL